MWCRCDESKVRWRNRRESCNREADMLTQNENLTRAILAAINTQSGIRLAILFGSLAAGRERADSDLDLAVDAKHQRLVLCDALR